MPLKNIYDRSTENFGEILNIPMATASKHGKNSFRDRSSFSLPVCLRVAWLRAGSIGKARRLVEKSIEGRGQMNRFASFVFNAANRSQCGFTLLELLVVMVIIGLLAGYVGPKYFAQIGKSEVKAARAQIDALEKALDQYRLDIGRYPGGEAGLNALITRPTGEPKWQGPYLKKTVPDDPWGHSYIYRIPGEHGEFDLLSYGRDGQAGGSGEDADITNW